MYLFDRYFFPHFLLDDCPTFYFSCEYIDLFRRDTLKWDFIHGLWNDIVCWKFIFTFWLSYCLLFMISKVLTFFDDSLPVCFLKAWLLGSDCFVCQVSRFLGWEVFLLWRRAWCITEVWYLSWFLHHIPRFKGLMCLQCWLCVFFLGEVKRIFP